MQWHSLQKWWVNQGKYVLFLLILYITIAAFSYHKYGVKVVADSPRYLTYALDFTKGFGTIPHNRFYMGYLLFTNAVRVVSGSADPYYIVIVQYFLGAIAVIALFKAGNMIFDSRLAGFLGACLFILFFEATSWSSYILCEGVYTSFICFSVYFSVRLLYKKDIEPILPIAILVIIYTAFTKPTGVAFLVAYLTLGIYGFGRR